MKNLEYLSLDNNLELFAKKVVEGFITGKHKSPFHGFSVEFAEHKLYNTGDSTKHIDWKLFARTDKLFLKRYEEETNLRCQLVIDSSSSMFYPNFKNPSLSKPNKLLFSIYASAILINILKRQRDAVGLSVYSDKLHFHTPNKTTQRHHRLIYTELKKILKINAIQNIRETNTKNILNDISRMLHKRSLIMVFTDLISPDQGLDEQFEAFKHMKYNNHEVILFYLTEKNTESNLDFDNRPYKFIDVETREEIKLTPSQYKKYYRQKTEKFIDDLKLKCLQYKIDLVEVDINQGFNRVLNGYLLKRQKML